MATLTVRGVPEAERDALALAGLAENECPARIPILLALILSWPKVSR